MFRVLPSRLSRSAVPLVLFLGTVLLGYFDGGYFPPAWGWATLACAWIVVLALVTRREVSLSAGEGIWLAALLALALVTRLFPARLGTFDPIAGYRLSDPIRYWNAFGIFAALGALLALGFVARAGSVVGRGFAGASLVVLLPTLYFTYARGAWVALELRLVAAIALDPRRLRLMCLRAVPTSGCRRPGRNLAFSPAADASGLG